MMRFSVNSVLSIFAFAFAFNAQAAANYRMIQQIESAAKPTKISVMAYNVENLFDTEHDEDRDDWTNLPLAFKQANPDVMKKECAKMTTPFYQQECLTMDWSETVLATKMTRVADTILQVNNGRGPDVLILEEVENIRVIQQLNDQYLKAAGYKTVVLVEGEDERGIDVGILSRLSLAEPARINLIEFTPDANNANWKRPTTRGIMEAPLRLPNGQTLYVLGFHFPSQSNPLQHRIDAVNTLNKIMQSKGPGALVVAGGDSNITAVEDQKAGLVSKNLAALWTVSHLIGCKDCSGTHFYKGGWDYLDLLLFSEALTAAKISPLTLIPESIRTPTAGKYQMKKDGTPARFDENMPTGVSDHLPLYGELLLLN